MATLILAKTRPAIRFSARACGTSEGPTSLALTPSSLPCPFFTTILARLGTVIPVKIRCTAVGLGRLGWNERDGEAQVFQALHQTPPLALRIIRVIVVWSRFVVGHAISEHDIDHH